MPKYAHNLGNSDSLLQGIAVNFVGGLMAALVARFVSSSAAPRVGLPPLSWKLSVLIGLAVTWLGFIYLLFRKPESRLLTQEGHPNRITTLRPRTRRSLKIAVLVLPFLVAASFLIFYWHEKSLPPKILILVADFEPSGSPLSSYRVTRSIVEHLTNATTTYPDVAVERLYRFISWKDGRDSAREEGERRKAAMVIWGDYDTTPDTAIMTINIELMGEHQLPVMHVREDLKGGLPNLTQLTFQ